jgi:hypothetical protein
VHTIVETPAYLRAAEEAGLSERERQSIVDLLSRDPQVGDVISGTGGCRKLRFGRGSKGKSGGVRVITFFSGIDLPLFLITVFAKNERSDLSKAEANALALMTKRLVETYSIGGSRRTR